MNHVLKISDNVEISSKAWSVLTEVYSNQIYGVSINTNDCDDINDVIHVLCTTLGEVVARMVAAGEMTLKESFEVSSELGRFINNIPEDQLEMLIDTTNDGPEVLLM